MVERRIAGDYICLITALRTCVPRCPAARRSPGRPNESTAQSQSKHNYLVCIVFPNEIKSGISSHVAHLCPEITHYNGSD